eukprot:405611_1
MTGNYNVSDLKSLSSISNASIILSVIAVVFVIIVCCVLCFLMYKTYESEAEYGKANQNDGNDASESEKDLEVQKQINNELIPGVLHDSNIEMDAINTSDIGEVIDNIQNKVEKHATESIFK